MFGGRIKPSTVDAYINSFQGATIPASSTVARWISFLAQQTGKTGSRTYLENEFLKAKGFSGSMADMIIQWVGSEDGLRAEMASTNLIANSDFETNTTGWTGNAVTIASVTTSPYRGTRCLQATVTSVATNPAVLTTITTSVGKVYSVSAYVKGTAGDLVYMYADGLTGAYTELTTTGAWQRIAVSGVSSLASSPLEVGVAKATIAVSDLFFVDAVTLKLNK